MKYFTVILALVIISASAEWKLKSQDEWMKIHDDCIGRFKIPNELMENTKQQKYPPKKVFENVLCYLRGLEIWSDSDGFLVDRIMIGFESAKENISNYNEKLLREGLVICSDKNEEASSTFDWAYRCFNCFIDNKYLMDSLNKVTFFKEKK